MSVTVGWLFSRLGRGHPQAQPYQARRHEPVSVRAHDVTYPFYSVASFCMRFKAAAVSVAAVFLILAAATVVSWSFKQKAEHRQRETNAMYMALEDYVSHDRKNSSWRRWPP